MTAHKGSQKQGSVYRGSARVKRAYKGSTLVYTRKVQTSDSKLFNTAGTFSFALPAELRSLTVVAVGAGGGGATSTFYHGNKWQGRAGASGAVCRSVFTGQVAKNLRGKALTCTVGASGTAGGGAVSGGPYSSGGRIGGDGGTSTITGDGIAMSATGGKGGMGGWYNNGHAAAAGTATGGNNLNKSGYAAPYNANNVFAPTPSAWDDKTTGYGAGGWQEAYDGTIHAGVVGCVYIEYTYLKAVE